MSAKTPCIFCGDSSASSSDEHVLPHHWKKNFPNEPGIGSRHMSKRVVTERAARKHVSPYDLKIPHVCAPCNNGWMRILDEGIKPLIFGLAAGDIRDLSAKDVDALSRWATKVALVRSYLDRHATTGVNLPTFSRFYKLGEPTLPRSLQIGWCDEHIGTLSSNSVNIKDAESASGTPAARDTANVVAIKIGHVFFQCGISTGSAWSTARTRKMMAASRLHAPGRLLPAPVGRAFTLPLDPLTDIEVDFCIEPMYLMGEGQFVGSPPSLLP